MSNFLDLCCPKCDDTDRLDVLAEIWVRVTDDGVGLPADWRMETCSGLGLRVTRERLEALYSPADDRFAISPRPGGGVEVTIRIPFNAPGAETDGLAA